MLGKHRELQDKSSSLNQGILSKIRHFHSLGISLTVVRLLTLKWNKQKLLSHFFRLFGSSNDEEVTAIFDNLHSSDGKKQKVSLKNSLFIGMVLKLNLKVQTGLTLSERVYLNFLLRKIPIQHKLVNSRIGDISTSSHKLLNKRLLNAKKYFERSHTTYVLPFRNLDIIDSNCLTTERGVVFDRRGRAYYNDPSIK